MGRVVFRRPLQPARDCDNSSPTSDVDLYCTLPFVFAVCCLSTGTLPVCGVCFACNTQALRTQINSHYVQQERLCNMEARSRNGWCLGKEINITYCVVCGLSYPACKAQAPYSLLWFLFVYHIFPHSLKNGSIFGGGGGMEGEKRFLVFSAGVI